MDLRDRKGFIAQVLTPFLWFNLTVVLMNCFSTFFVLLV